MKLGLDMKVTVVIPLRITELVYEAEERLRKIIETIPSFYFDILIVDYGTPDKYKEVFNQFDFKHVNIVKLDVQDKIFSISVARDTGVQYAKTDIVFFHDIDFFASSSMYESLYFEIQSRDMQNNARDFFCIPVFFLTKNGTEVFRTSLDEERDFNFKIQNKIIKDDFDFVDFPAYGSSAIVVNKRHYLSIGGHSREFFGHGAEDYDILHRLSSYNQVGPRTVNYYKDLKSNQINVYEGFRAFFALYGIDVFQKSLFFVHLWHPTRQIPGYHQSNRNFSLLEKLMKEFDRDKTQPQPLMNLQGGGNALVLIKANSSILNSLRQVFPLLGRYSILDEDVFKTDMGVVEYVQRNNINSVGLLNPYGNEHRLNIYRELKTAGINFWVFDRGALPNSWFFDQGFNYDSNSYRQELWDKKLTDKEDAEITEYISDLKSSEKSLEKNGARTSAEFLREKYSISNRKVLFIPFQRPNDSVVKYFSGNVESMSNFYSWVHFISESLDPSEWVVLTKKHPLETTFPMVENTIEVDPETHIHDLLELADKVFLINSGVGLLSLLFNTPVICAGKAFYMGDGLAGEAADKEHALSLVLNKSDSLCLPKIKSFTYYLVNNLYSFGESKYKYIGGAENRQSIVKEILFSTINIAGEKYQYGENIKGVSLDAPLFYSFGGRQGIKSLINESKKSKIKPSIHVKSKTKNFDSNFKRKARKLVKHPVLFFKDMIAKW